MIDNEKEKNSISEQKQAAISELNMLAGVPKDNSIVIEMAHLQRLD